MGSLFAFILVLCTPATAAETPNSKIFDEAGERVFKVGIATTDFSELQGHGTGFVVGKDGFLATAYHVTNSHLSKNGGNIFVIRKGARIRAALWAVDPVHDLAILKIPAVFPEPWPIKNELVKNGSSSFLLGFPGLGEFSVVNGIVQSGSVSEMMPSYQITAPIAAGMSGGPVLDAQVGVIGVILATATSGGDVSIAAQSAPLEKLVARALARDKEPSPEDIKREELAGHFEAQSLEASILEKIFQTRSDFNGWRIPGGQEKFEDVICRESSEINPARGQTPNRYCQFKMSAKESEVTFLLGYSAVPRMGNQFRTASLARTLANSRRSRGSGEKRLGQFSCKTDFHHLGTGGVPLNLSICTRISHRSWNVYETVVRAVSLDYTRTAMVATMELKGFNEENTDKLVQHFLDSLEVSHDSLAEK